MTADLSSITNLDLKQTGFQINNNSKGESLGFLEIDLLGFPHYKPTLVQAEPLYAQNLC